MRRTLPLSAGAFSMDGSRSWTAISVVTQQKRTWERWIFLRFRSVRSGRTTPWLRANIIWPAAPQAEERQVVFFRWSGKRPRKDGRSSWTTPVSRSGLLVFYRILCQYPLHHALHIVQEACTLLLGLFLGMEGQGQIIPAHQGLHGRMRKLPGRLRQ